MLNRSAGSAYLELGTSKVTVAVNGPRQCDARASFTARGGLNVSVHIAPFAGMPRERGKVCTPVLVRCHKVDMT
jgi:ribonuclease PH